MFVAPERVIKRQVASDDYHIRQHEAPHVPRGDRVTIRALYASMISLVNRFHSPKKIEGSFLILSSGRLLSLASLLANRIYVFLREAYAVMTAALSLWVILRRYQFAATNMLCGHSPAESVEEWMIRVKKTAAAVDSLVHGKGMAVAEVQFGGRPDVNL